jgi:hypothetical protein
VIVTLKHELPEAQARTQLQEAGVSPLRRLGARMCEFVQPNWWRPRKTK